MKSPVYAFGSLGRLGFAPIRQLETLHRLCAPIAACLFGEFTHLVINNYKKLRLETFALEEMPIGQRHINWDEEIVHLEPSDPDMGKATFSILHDLWFFYLSTCWQEEGYKTDRICEALWVAEREAEPLLVAGGFETEICEINVSSLFSETQNPFFEMRADIIVAPQELRGGHILRQGRDFKVLARDA